MDNETALMHLLNDMKTRKEFAPMEYECLFQKVENQYIMGDALRLLYDTKQVLLLSNKDFHSMRGDTVLDKLINCMSKLVDVDIIRLLNAESKKRELLVELSSKTERQERQIESLYNSHKQRRHVERQIRKHKRKLNGIERDINMFSSGTPSVKLFLLFRDLKEEEK